MAANRARLTGGLEITMYAAAAPADATSRLATVRADLSVMSARQLRSDPVTALVASRAKRSASSTPRDTTSRALP